MKKNTSQNYRSLALIVLALILFVTGIQMITKSTEAQRIFTPSNSHKISGRLEGAGTYFSLKSSASLAPVSVSTIEQIKLSLEYFPQMMKMLVIPLDGTPRTKLTLNGLKPLATYYKYQDNYHHMVEFVTDEKGRFTYTQDLNGQHLIFIQTQQNIFFLNANGGDCVSIGVWDQERKTCTLTIDVSGTIQIDDDGITLNGNGHKIQGNGTGSGIYLSGRSGVTIQNSLLSGFFDGISFYQSHGNSVSGNSLTNNIYGIRLVGSKNTILKNSFDTHTLAALYLESGNSHSNIIQENTVAGGERGVYLYFAGPQNLIESNKINLTKFDGILALYTPEVTIHGNEIAHADSGKSGYAGITIGPRTTGTTFRIVIAENTIRENGSDGIVLNTFPIALNEPESIAIHGNSIFGNGGFGVNSSYPIELSYQGKGNHWGHATPPCFREKDSNDIQTVVDSYPVCRGSEIQDTVPPVISVSEIPEEVLLNTALTFTFSATDDLSGVASVTGTLDNGAITSGETRKMTVKGTHVFRVQAIDKAGNERVYEKIFRVIYKFGGFLPPIRMDEIGTYKLGRQLPVKFQLFDVSGEIVSGVLADLVITKLSDSSVTSQEIRFPGAFEASGKHYSFHLETKSLSAGKWRLGIQLDDGKLYEMMVLLR